MKPLSASPDGEDGGLAQRRRAQVERITCSKLFRNAPALQRLLQYLAHKTIEGQGDQLKEYSIGVDVFERRVDYDPKTDTVVRVEVHRLRQKLKEYYETEGASDPIVFQIPRGHYILSFTDGGAQGGNGVSGSSTSTATATAQTQTAGVDSHSKAGSVGPGRIPILSQRAVLLLALALFFVLGILVGTNWKKLVIGNRSEASLLHAGSRTAKSNDLVRGFWAAFLGNDVTPIIGYADAVFLVDESDDLFRFRHGATDKRGTHVDPHLARQFASNSEVVARAGPLFYEDGYSGIGDVQSIYRLTQLFTQMGYSATAQRCRLVTIDDLQEHNVVLLGSSFQNEAVAQLFRGGEDFVYEASPDRVHALWNGRILNLHPQPGEAASYQTERDPVTGIVKADYALVTIRPGISPGRFIAVLGALDTSGVMGATRFVTSEAGLAELNQRLASSGEAFQKASPPFFQALLKVDVENGLDVLAVRLLAIHPIRAANGRDFGSTPQPPPSKSQ